MSSVRIARIADFCTTGTGGTPSRDKFDRYYDGGTIPWVKSGELREETIYGTEERITELALKETNVKRVPPGALLLAMYGATVGRLATLGVEATTNQAVCHIIPDPTQGDVRYLFHALRSQVASIIGKGVGGAQPNISQGIVKHIKVPLPPLAEQRRIADILDRVDSLRAMRRAAIDQLETLSQSIFFDMFGDPATNSKAWPTSRLGEICTVDSPLVDPRREEYRHFLHYGPDRIQRDTGELLPAKTAVEDGLISAKFLFDENAILYSKIRPNLNKVALAEARGLCSADVYPVNVKPEKLAREFLWCLLRGAHFLSYTAEVSNRANIPKINREQFLKYVAVCPPITLQTEFAQKIRKVRQLKTSHRASLVELEALFASYQQEAFDEHKSQQRSSPNLHHRHAGAA
ncbi:MAG TPA: restriction endonuclease subunit S [Steroidobacter sp.]|uniref:restriction endonuclease subunit S n=1 Tax=Steroidobacter sp. TaxID=1978227 RepID=UPI002ED97D4D